MCLADARYFETPEAEGRIVLDKVRKMKVDGDTVTVWNLFGEKCELKGRVSQVDFEKSTIDIVSLDAIPQGCSCA